MNFFTDQELAVIRGDEALKKRPNSSQSELGCEDCGLFRTCLSPYMKPTGEGRLGILVVAEAPGSTEDQRGEQLVGKAGRLLRTVLRELGHDLDRDFWKTNAIICRPPDNETPTNLQLTACRPFLLETIERFNPRVVLLLGKPAVDSFFGPRLQSSRLTSLSMTDWRGERIPDQETGIWVCPTWHPSYVMRMKYDRVVRRQFKEDIREAIALASTEVPDYSTEGRVVHLTDEEEIVNTLNDLRRREKPLAYDFETTGLKPFREGHRIVYAGFSDGNKSWAFRFPKVPSFELGEAFAKLINSESVPKIAQNIKFEIGWGLEHYKIRPKKIVWDTMLAAHSLANRKRNNLKFLAFCAFGILGYDSKADRFLKAPSKQEALYGANAFNLVEDLDPADGREYVGLDALLTYWLAREQKKRMPKALLPGVRFFTEVATDALADTEREGMRWDLEEAHRITTKLDRRIQKYLDKIENSPELDAWSGNHPFRPLNDNDLRRLLYKDLGFAVGKETESGKTSVDKEALSVFRDKSEIVDLTLEAKRWETARNTYIIGFTRQATDGAVHPTFNLNIVDTFRSSCNDPNLQNVPKRDAQVLRLVRRLLRPRPGFYLSEWDYKAVEVCISACYNEDPNLIAYIEDPATDMHRDQAAECYVREPGEVTKVERSEAKNKFVFPEFYGSNYENTGPDLWNAAPPETKEHLKSVGLGNIDDFVEHIRMVEDRFWGERFAVYAEWKEKIWHDYQKKGYVELYTGFRCYGPLDLTEATNYQIQGSAFHVLLWTYSQITKEITRRKMRSRHIGQIHDAGLGDCHPEEEREIDQLWYEFGTQKVREHWDWIIVPLSIEKSRSAVDGSWAEMKEIGLLGPEGET